MALMVLLAHWYIGTPVHFWLQIGFCSNDTVAVSQRGCSDPMSKRCQSEKVKNFFGKVKNFFGHLAVQLIILLWIRLID